ncbi:amidohydrolase family protein [Sphingomonas aerophila]|uniref:Imidazolonepropionase-like amidohydrolase n=1 Tax=Sphingomonas aerophila TaxID=1344948 RepID=A0A7W9EXX5_9SPHN|nr:amidohydrolase family protein [Sphingomonas aerophila]MBB5717023.1 imidazolonepropionase-like amidohydrolase [Sphingomonas aerophila]
MVRIHRATSIIVAAVLANWAGRSQAADPPPFAPSRELVILRHATLLDGLHDEPRSDMDIVVQGERIKQVVRDADLDAGTLRAARAIDLRGRFVIPGMIDAHVHLATPPNRRQAEAILRRDIYGGVTAVRDMADDLRAVGDLARASLVGEIAAPDIYYAALMAGPAFFTDERTSQTSAGGKPGYVPWMQAVTDRTDTALAVAQARGTYATAIKLYGDMTPDVAARITKEAHRQQMKVWAHATLYPAKPSEVVAAGVDTVSHACLLVREPMTRVLSWAEPRTPVDMTGFRGGSNAALARLFAEMKQRGTILDATIWAYSADTAGSTTMPPLPPGSCDDTIGGAITGQAYRAGVLIDAGTDNLADYRDPWPDLLHEFAAMSKAAGMPNTAILRAATLVAARAAGQEADMGSVEAGKLANLVVLTRNPLLELDNLKTVLMTMKRGRMLERTAFIPLTKEDITDR